NFGPLLDKFEAEHKAYDAFMEKQATNPDTAKEKAAKKKVTDAATAAYAAAGKYAAALKQVEDHSTGATRAATTALLNVLSMQIGFKLKKAREGLFCPAGESAATAQCWPLAKQVCRRRVFGQPRPVSLRSSQVLRYQPRAGAARPAGRA